MGQGLIDQCEGLSFQSQFCYCAVYTRRRRESRCFEAGLLLHSTNCPPSAWLLQLMLYGQWHSCNLSAAAKYLHKNTGLKWQLSIEEFSNQTFGFLVLLFFVNLLLICGVGVVTWECTFPPGNSHQERTLQHRNLERHLQPRLRNRSVIRTLDWDVEDLFFLCPSFALALGYCKRKGIFLNLLQELSTWNK